MEQIRILIAIEDEYRAYRSAIGAVIGMLRPHFEVVTIELETLRHKVERFDPQVVISGEHKYMQSESVLAWITLSIDPTLPTKVCVGGRYSEMTNPTVEALLPVIDEVEHLIQAGENVTSCCPPS